MESVWWKFFFPFLGRTWIQDQLTLVVTVLVSCGVYCIKCCGHCNSFIKAFGVRQPGRQTLKLKSLTHLVPTGLQLRPIQLLLPDLLQVFPTRFVQSQDVVHHPRLAPLLQHRTIRTIVLGVLAIGLLGGVTRAATSVAAGAAVVRSLDIDTTGVGTVWTAIEVMDPEEASGVVGPQMLSSRVFGRGRLLKDDAKFPETGNAINMDAYRNHLLHAKRKAYEPAKMIWAKQMEMPKVFHELPRLQYNPEKDDWHVIPILESVEDDEEEGEILNAKPPKRMLATTAKQISWKKKLADHRMTGIKKWLVIVERGLRFFQCGLQWEQEQDVDLGDMISDILSRKSTNTIHSRAGPILRYIDWCLEGGQSPIPFEEILLYKFVSDVGAKAAPTFSRSFLCSVAFTGHVLGCESAVKVLESRRLTGAAAKHFKEKRKTQQKPPLSVAHVKLLEEIVLGIPQKRKIADRLMAGFCMWLVTARARYSDGQSAGVLQLDAVETGEGLCGYIEARVSRSKTSMTVEKRTKYLPMAGKVRMFQKQSWAKVYLELLHEAGIEMAEDKPLMPTPTVGGWGSLPLTAEAAAAWLRALLTTAGVDSREAAALGTHSCKATMLSWAAKAGVPKEFRSTLGYHGPRGSVEVYSRDEQAEALRRMDSVVDDIVSQKFCPDSTRSGYYAAGPRAEPEQGSSSDNSSSEDSLDEESPDHQGEEVAIERTVGRWDAGLRLEAVENRQYFRHLVSRVIHVVADEAGASFMCGRAVSGHFARLDKRPVVMNPLCKQCFCHFARA